jgi:hypothetical protein
MLSLIILSCTEKQSQDQPIPENLIVDSAQTPIENQPIESILVHNVTIDSAQDIKVLTWEEYENQLRASQTPEDVIRRLRSDFAKNESN